MLWLFQTTLCQLWHGLVSSFGVNTDILEPMGTHVVAGSPPQLPSRAVTRVVCLPGPPVYADSSTATQAHSPGWP